MRKFVVEVYSDNDITERAIFVELSGRFGNMIASVKEEAAQHSVQADGALPSCKCNAYQLENFGCKCGAAETPRR